MSAARLTSLVTTCRRDPSSASIACALETLATTRRRAPSPVSTPQTLEPEWCSGVVAFLALAGAPPGLLVLERGALAFILLAEAPPGLLVGAVRHL